MYPMHLTAAVQRMDTSKWNTKPAAALDEEAVNGVWGEVSLCPDRADDI